jgi:hypothetical protein
MHPDPNPSRQDGKTEDISMVYRDPGRRNPWLLPLLLGGALLALASCALAVIFLVRG